MKSIGMVRSVLAMTYLKRFFKENLYGLFAVPEPAINNLFCF